MVIPQLVVSPHNCVSRKIFPSLVRKKPHMGLKRASGFPPTASTIIVQTDANSESPRKSSASTSFHTWYSKLCCHWYQAAYIFHRHFSTTLLCLLNSNGQPRTSSILAQLRWQEASPIPGSQETPHGFEDSFETSPTASTIMHRQ